MLEYLFASYLFSLAEFWGFVFRIGLPQILLAILFICWLLRRKGCGGTKGGCRMWSFGCCGGDSQGGCRVPIEGCPRACYRCCRRETGGVDEGGEEHGDE